MKKLIALAMFMAIASTACAGEHFLTARPPAVRKITGFRATIYGDHVFELQTGTIEGKHVTLTNTGKLYYDRRFPCKVEKVGETIKIEIQ